MDVNLDIFLQIFDLHLFLKNIFCLILFTYLMLHIIFDV